MSLTLNPKVWVFYKIKHYNYLGLVIQYIGRFVLSAGHDHANST